jgi:uncharacterized protein (TIGR03437 family)
MTKYTIACLVLSVSPLLAGPSITLPLAFERNAGQTDPQVKYLTRGHGGTVWLTEQGPVLAVIERSAETSRDTSSRITGPRTARTKAKTAVLRMRFDGGKRTPKIEGVSQTGGVTNYFIGNDPAKWRTDVPQFQQVRYRDVYPGIDVVFYGNDRNLEYDFVLQPGADPSRISLRFDGPGILTKDSNGDLVLKMGDTEIRNHKPVIRQAGRTVEGEYKLSGKRSARFAVGPYDRSRALVIDPVMTYGTLQGGANGDQGSQVTMDAQGNLYMVGTTISTNFPLKTPLYDPQGGIPLHTFLTKINPSASGAASVVFSTLFGGNNFDVGFSVGVDASGSAVISGYTDSTNLPVQNAFQSTPPQMNCILGDDSTTPIACFLAFVAKFSAAGNSLVFSTYMGTSGNYYPNRIAMDSSGNAWLAGYTNDAFLPIRGNSYQSSTAANSNVTAGFVTEFTPAGALMYSTYFNGENSTQINGIAISAAGNVVIGGLTDCLRLPISQGAFLTSNPASSQSSYQTGFVAELNPNVGGPPGLLYGTYLGGGATDNVLAVAVDSSGNLYAGGAADSGNFPVTENGFRTSALDIYGIIPGAGDGFVTKLNPAASGAAQVLYSTFFGGSGDDEVTALAVDSAGRVVITGVTNSPDLYTTPDAIECCFFGVTDPPTFVTTFGFLARLDPTKSGLASLLNSTLLGGSLFTDLGSLALDSTGNNVVVGGYVASPDTPVTQSAFQSVFGGNGTPYPNENPIFDNLSNGDAYIASFSFAVTGPSIALYENGGGLSAMPNPTIAPGLVFTVKGTFPGPAAASLAAINPATGRLATVLEGVQVLVSGIACPLTYVSATQINAIAPYEIVNNTVPLASVQVVVNNVPGNILFILIAATAPGILSFDDGTGQGAIVNQDGTINGPSNAAPRGTIVTIYATGEGQTSPPGIDGGLATNLNALPHPVAPLSLTIGGVAATNIAYAGTAPDEVYGLLQINVTVPAGVTPGPAVPVVLTVGGVSSQAGLTMAVQ